MGKNPAHDAGKGEGGRRGRATAGRPKLSEEIDGLIASFTEHAVTLREVLGVLRGRAYTLLLLLLALPFCTPIPLPGVSVPFGLTIALIGFRLALRQKPWLPARLLDTAVPSRLFTRMLRGARKLIRFLEHALKPRWIWLVENPVTQHMAGAMILVCGLLMLLPFPIPFSNGLPALTVVLLAAALLERDGYMMIAGLCLFLLTAAFFTALYFGGTEAMGWLTDFAKNLFLPPPDPTD